MSENYVAHATYKPKEQLEKDLENFTKHKIYGFKYTYDDMEKIETLVQNNCIEKFGDVLFDTTTLAKKIYQDAHEENNEDYRYNAFARWISIMFMQALVEDDISEELRTIIKDYIFNNKKNYYSKINNKTMIRLMHKSCCCYPEALFWEILDYTKSDIIGEPVFLRYGRTVYCKVWYSKPNEDGTELIICSQEEAQKAVGPYNTPEEDAEIERRIKHIDKIFDELEAQGKTFDEIKAIIDKMRKEGTL